MSLKSNSLIRKSNILFYIFCFLLITPLAKAQIYSHNFGTTAITNHPYNVNPNILDSHLQNSSWRNSVSSWTSNTGATGEAIRITTATNATITLTFDVSAGFQADITAFDFWRQRSNTGPQNWTMAVNGIPVGNGTTGTAGAALGNTAVSNTISGLTGTVTVTINISNSTGNGTFRLDDFKLYGSVTSNCTSATIASFTPLSGPQNTLVIINGNGFLAGSGTTAVRFNGTASSFTVISDTVIEAYLPPGVTSGNVSVVTNGCEGFSAASFTVIKTTAATNYSSDIYISELYDAQAGDGGIIEIYNGTAAAVNLSGYSIRRYGDIGGSTFYTINLTGTIPPGGIFLVGIGTGTVPCGITSGQHYSTGFNSNDEFELYNGSTLIDNIHTPANVGYSMIRNANAVAPKPAYNSNDWNQNSSSTESCANIGRHTVSTVTPPTVTSPTSKISCENNSVVFTASLSNPTGYNYQWKVLDNLGNWVNVANVSPYSGAGLNSLTINPVPANFDANQYYCQMTSGGNVLVSNAAQLEVNPATIPNFQSVWNICSGDVISIGNTSPKGISGTWFPTTFSNATGGTYLFTPNVGQCATTQSITISINPATVPNFQSVWNICSGDVISIGNTSPNGISGTWFPTTFSNTIGETYTFTPNSGQCATTQSITINVNAATVPNFQSVWNICSGDAISIGNTSPNGISGTWFPTTFSNTIGGTYTFTPNSGQCATTQSIAISINPATVPNFQSVWNICSGDAISIGNTSPNGISGTWFPTTFSNTIGGTYTFTPNSGQCATTQSIAISINPATVPNFQSVWNICSGDAISIGNTSPNGIIGTWFPTTFSNTIGGTYTFTPNAGQCATTQSITISINPAMVPNFQSVWNICSGDVISIGNTSPNGIIGTWFPTTFSNATGGTYTFTPNAGQCATTQSITISINAAMVPNFQSVWNICSGDAISIGNTSPNGISGTWFPTTFSNATGGTYTFTPNAGQCATTQSITISINPATVPDFQSVWNICSGDVIAIGNTSPNGIIGTWFPTTFSNTIGGTYLFTPNSGQCATTQSITISINPATIPNFQSVWNICSGDVISIGNTSPNGIIGTWFPTTFSNATGGTYTFTPNAGQCATTQSITISINPATVPNFQSVWNICSGDVISIGNTSPNGISGTWFPTTFSNTIDGTYTFTPNAGQCATTQSITISINAATVPNFQSVWNICSGDVISIGNTSPNGISGTWFPTTFSNTVGGIYTFTPNSGQCATTQSLTINITSVLLSPIAGVHQVCEGNTITLSNTVSGGIWSSSDTTAAIVSTTGIVSGIAAGTTVISYTITVGNCSKTVSHTINVQPLPKPKLKDQNFCVDGKTGLFISDIILDSNVPNAGHSFVWTLNNQILPTSGNIHVAKEVGVYKVLVTNSVTGCSQFAECTLGVSEIPSATAVATQDFHNNQTITVTVSPLSDRYRFQLNDGPFQQGSVFDYVKDGENTVTIIDTKGCGTVNLSVYVLNYPRFFTPNGDGYNDTWNIGSLPNKNGSVIHIFDRMGKLIKVLKPSENNGWDGTYNGQPLPATDFWFQLEYQNNKGIQEEFKAHFSLKR